MSAFVAWCPSIRLASGAAATQAAGRWLDAALLAERMLGRRHGARGTNGHWRRQSGQAARTVLRNFSTSFFRWSLSRASDCAADSTWPDAELVSLDPRLTSVTSEATCVLSCADCCTFRAISCVAAPCCSTAAAMAEETSET